MAPCQPSVSPGLQGDFARAQAEYLQPDIAQVDGLVQTMSSKKIGIVAHFYMDPQVGRSLHLTASRQLCITF
jgi:hypothetical protein